jgi:hypothetical protein
MSEKSTAAVCAEFRLALLTTGVSQRNHRSDVSHVIRHVIVEVTASPAELTAVEGVFARAGFRIGVGGSPSIRVAPASMDGDLVCPNPSALSSEVLHHARRAGPARLGCLRRSLVVPESDDYELPLEGSTRKTSSLNPSRFRRTGRTSCSRTRAALAACSGVLRNSAHARSSTAAVDRDRQVKQDLVLLGHLVLALAGRPLTPHSPNAGRASG